MNKTLSDYERGLLEAIANDMIICDDNGEAWYWSQGRIRLVAAELEQSRNEIDENGYGCRNFDEGIKLLVEYGYLTAIS